MQFSLTCQATELEQIEALMLDLGAISLSLSDAGDDPIFEPLPGDTPVWPDSKLTATFDSSLEPDTLHQQLLTLLPTHLIGGLRRGELCDQDWHRVYKNHFKPLQCAPNLWIVPSWLSPPDPDATVIRLDPGLAFGTGAHPTTALCLAWMARSNLRNRQIIDYGCGSGILAIAACMLGAKRVRAVDIDPQALNASESNRQSNGIEHYRLQLSSPETMERQPADLLAANILAGPLTELAPVFDGLVKPGGQILLSGILKSQLNAIQLAYRCYFELQTVTQKDDWVCVSGNKFR